MSIGIVLLIFLLLFFVIGTPIVYALGGSAILALLIEGGTNMTIVGQRLFQGANSFPYLALPFFILAGNLMSKGGISRRLVDFFMVLLGRLKGGLALVTIVVSAFFSAICGSNAATCAAVGATMLPGMKENGYDEAFAAATVASGSCMGIIIPPSVAVVIYCIIANVSVGKALMAGVMPGILFAVFMCAWAYFYCRKHNYGGMDKTYSLKEKFQAFFQAVPALLMPAIILGGIYGGLFTATEAACVACVYGLVVSIFVYKELSFKELPKILLDTAITSSNILVIIAAANIFGMVLTRARIPDAVTVWLTSFVSSKWMFWIVVNILFLILGMLMETIAIMLIVTPLLLPVAVTFGIDPIHFGIIMIANLALGMVTPPFGLCLFLASDMAKVNYVTVVKRVLPYIGAMFVALMLCTFIPELSMLFVPN